MKIATIGCEAWLNEHERGVECDIAQSTISALTTQEALALDGEGGAGFYEMLNREQMSYGWIEGSPEFKEEVSRLYRSVLPENVLQTNGASGANLLALMALVEPGDHVVAEYPTYQPLYEIPRMLGAEVELWRLKEELDWSPDIADLERLVRPNTKLICINNASNPTGTVLDAETVRKVADIAREVGAYVLSDEVYLPLEGTEEYLSMADVYEKAIVVNSLSKTYSMPGIRVGWAVSSPEIADVFRSWRDYTMICCGVFNDAMAVHVLRNRERVLDRNRALMARNKAIAQEWIDAEPRARWVAPKGVSTSYVRFDIPVDDETFCLDLLDKHGVLLIPGSRFDLPCGARLGYCAPEGTLREGLSRLSRALRDFD